LSTRANPTDVGDGHRAPGTSERTAAAPVAPGERLETLDILRAFALQGILLVNFPGIASDGRFAGLDRIVGAALSALVAGSFYPLFSFLFGMGLGVQLLRARQRGQNVALIYFRRLVVLFLIGTAHAVLVWGGDILVDYSLIGLVLLAVHRLSTRAILALAMIVLLAGVVYPAFEPALAGGSATPEWIASSESGSSLRYGVLLEEERIAAGERLAGAESAPTALKGALMERAWTYLYDVRSRTNPIGLAERWGNTILLAFLLGLFAGRRRWFEDVGNRRRAFAAALVIGVMLSVSGKAYQASGLELGVAAADFFDRIPNLGVTVFYVSLLTLMTAREGVALRALRLIAPAGRMGLTNYLMQSLVMTLFVFEPYGLHLGDPGPILMLGVHVLFFLCVQVPLSHWWLRRFRFGPAEWVWRSLTYGSPQALRIPVTA
jgi:uncharacterized protein